MQERLRERLGDIAQQVDASFPWAERLDLVSTVPIVLDDAQDDFKREMSFYNQALEAVKLARPRLAAANIKFTRPDDYFAEMVKTDDHMRKVREALLSEHQAVERSEQAKKSRQMKQFGKKVQQQVLEDRQKQKTSDLEAIKKFKKDRSAKPDFLDDGDDQFNIGVDKEESHSQKTNSKRSYKNDKYGNGGKKRGSKRNTRDSASDDSSFNFARNKALPKGFKSAGVAKKFGGGAGGKSKAPRPGKSRRRSAKSRQ
ncbi:hypothetical protein, variant [Capsaspora owczarzaki ATCC 30864]|uniref:Eukaryotic rRNA processing n=1 Tax=Capsaspora owczarzaki (strain ATCC 30864) TaxID=595528 RepID=A0A0D2WM13_CAPO3|nr:hypothetical protein, variant [Capsaspora owczarzaki ATCC 30864]